MGSEMCIRDRYIIAKTPCSFLKYFLFTTSALTFKKIIKKMNTLVINAADDKILFSLITNTDSYTTAYINSRENFDKIMILILNFLKEHDSNLDKISEIFVNQGPGKISSIRNSIAIAKGIAFAKNIDLYGFLSEHLSDKSVDQLIKIESSLSELKKASFSFNQRVVINSEIMCEANVLCGCVDLETKKPIALPEELRKRILDKKNAS